MTVKIKIEVGQLKVDFEGPESYLKTELPKLLKNLVQHAGQRALSNPGEIGDSSSSDSPLEPAAGLGNVEAIAGKLDCKTQVDLLVAGACYLTFTKGKTRFGGRELSEAMRSAAGYWKASYRNNQGARVKSAVKKGLLRSHGSGATKAYALDAAKKKELQQKLGI